MSLKIENLVLWLFVLNLGVVFGAGLYEARIEFPQWLVLLPDGTYQWNSQVAQAANTGLRFWIFISTVPLTLLMLLNLAIAWRSRTPIRMWWLTAALVILAERAFTFSYFIPTMLTLMQEETTVAPEVVNRAHQWGILNNLRHLLVFVALLVALHVFKNHHYLNKENQLSPAVGSR